MIAARFMRTARQECNGKARPKNNRRLAPLRQRAVISAADALGWMYVTRPRSSPEVARKVDEVTR